MHHSEAGRTLQLMQPQKVDQKVAQNMDRLRDSRDRQGDEALRREVAAALEAALVVDCSVAPTHLAQESRLQEHHRRK